MRGKAEGRYKGAGRVSIKKAKPESLALLYLDTLRELLAMLDGIDAFAVLSRGGAFTMLDGIDALTRI